MKNLSKLLVLSLLALVFTTFSCKKADQTYSVVPNNATMVVVFDGKALGEKSGFNSFSESKSFAMFKNSVAGEELKNFELMEPIMANPDESGLNLKSDFFLFSYKNESSFMAMAVKVLDKNKFKTTVQNIANMDGAQEGIGSEGGLDYFFSPTDPFIVWNETQMLMIVSVSGEPSKDMYLAEAKALFSNSGDKSLTDNKDFTKFLSSKKDISMWMDYSIFLESMDVMQQMAMASTMPFDMKGTIIHAFMDFQDGKAVMSYDVTMNKELKEFLDNNQVLKEKFDTELLEALPAKTYANFSIAFDFVAYYDLIVKSLEKSQMDMNTLDKQFKEQLGMTVKEALGEFAGEVSFNVHRIEFEEVILEYAVASEDVENTVETIYEPKVFFSVAVEMNNDKLFNALIEKAGGQLIPTDNYFSFSGFNMEAYLGLFGKKLIITSDEALIKQLGDGKVDGESLANTDIAANLKNYPGYGFLDLSMDSYPAETKKALAESMGEEDFFIFENLMSQYKMLEIKPKSATEAEIILWMKDDTKNSLELLLKSIDNNIEAFN